MFTMFMILTIVILLVFSLLILFENKNKQKMNTAFAIIGSIFALGANIVYLINVHNESLNTKSIFFAFIGFDL